MNRQCTNPGHPRCEGNGFTLIELSIIIIVIGLILGAVMVGRDLLEAAKIRSTVSQIEAINTAAMTFKNKYGGLPGDLVRATQFGFAGDSSPVRAGLGDGNGAIQNQAGVDTDSQNQLNYYYEQGWFWIQLNQSGLTNTNVDVTGAWTASGCPVTAIWDGAGKTSYFPMLPLSNSFLFVYSINRVNYVEIADNCGMLTCSICRANSLSPARAYSLDTKLDDGQPLTGIVRATGGGGGLDGLGYPAAVGGNCVGAGGAYNMTYGPAACSLQIKPPF